jgi:hypothetical protein
MESIGFKITDWIFFFDKKNKENLSLILSHPKNKDLKGEFVTWKLITVILPVITFLIVLILNIFSNLNSPELFFQFVNNGSLPIISFGVLTSGMPYLLEQLQTFPDFHVIRRRVMAIAIIFLFLSASLYILQTLHLISEKINCVTSVFLLLGSIYVFFYSSSIGYKMFLLQSKNIISLPEQMEEKVKDLKNAVDDLD